MKNPTVTNELPRDEAGLLRLYQRVTENRTIEILGRAWPIQDLIIPTRNASNHQSIQYL